MASDFTVIHALPMCNISHDVYILICTFLFLLLQPLCTILAMRSLWSNANFLSMLYTHLYRNLLIGRPNNCNIKYIYYSVYFVQKKHNYDFIGRNLSKLKSEKHKHNNRVKKNKTKKNTGRSIEDNRVKTRNFRVFSNRISFKTDAEFSQRKPDSRWTNTNCNINFNRRPNIWVS